jgi:2-polyprenyl-3-methyl-5-hydroxy-6-metoxy-1,4-benzoquinol methylase
MTTDMSIKERLFWVQVNVVWRLAYLARRLCGAVKVPGRRQDDPRREGYDFERARAYWHNVPRAGGARPMNSAELDVLSDGDLERLWAREMGKAGKKSERSLGVSLALECIHSFPSPRVMDFGSGFGFYGFAILLGHPGAHVTFADINEENLKIVERVLHLKGWEKRSCVVRVRDEKAKDLEGPASFDLILSMGVLHHTPHAREIVRNLSPLLKPGGTFEAMLYNRSYQEAMESITGMELDATGFGALTDPRKGDLANPYSESYDEAKARQLFEGYEFVDRHRSHPFYDVYRFRKGERCNP